MLTPKARSFLRRSTAIGFLIFFLSQPGHDTATVDRSAADAVPFYIETGDRVEAHYQAYGKLLSAYHETLLKVAQVRAPDLLARIQEPEPLPHGYQVLPKIVPDPVPTSPTAGQATAYSWPWTEQMIERERRNLLLSMSEVGSSQSRAAIEKYILEYPNVRERYRRIAAHIRYNRFWQAAIAGDRPAHDRETRLQDRALSYQRIVGVLKALATRTAGALPIQFGATLSNYEERLSERLGAVLYRVDPPRFVAVEQCDEDWTVRVPVLTDIDERPFIAAVKQIIESTWQVTDGKKRIRVELDVSYISPASLYEDPAEPPKGVTVNLKSHLERFPSETAILTTGALTTHVQKNAIVLGPGTVTPSLLAHEFGHILGFRDAYIRGYRDLHESGFQVRELVVFPNDIMAASATGQVHPDHFRRLIDSSKNRTVCAPRPRTAKPDPTKALHET